MIANLLRSELFEHIRAPRVSFLVAMGKTFIPRLDTKEISQLAAHLDGEGLLYS